MKRRGFLAMLAALFLPRHKTQKRGEVEMQMLKSAGAPEVECGGVRYFMLIGQDGKTQFYAYNTSGVPFRMKV